MHCTQRAVLRERGCNSPELLCKFASVVPVRTVVSPRPRKAATTLYASEGQSSAKRKTKNETEKTNKKTIFSVRKFIIETNDRQLSK